MKISWLDKDKNLITGRIEVQAHPYIEALGMDNAAQFLMQFGGTRLELPTKRVHRGTALSKVLQRMYGDGWKAKALELTKCIGIPNPNVPLCRTFLCRHLRSKGLSVNNIARALGTTCATVYRHLRTDEIRRNEVLKSRDRLIERAEYYKAIANA
jgi:hypothetical protein